jgi:hypothetical protein
MKKSKAPLKLLTDFENPSSTVTRFKDLKARSENVYRKPPVILQIILEAACDKLFLCIFPAANERSGAEKIDQSQHF